MKQQNSKARFHRIIPMLCFAVLLCLSGCGQSQVSVPPAAEPSGAVQQTPEPEASALPLPEPTDDYRPAEMTGRVALIQLLKSQLGSDGQIVDGDGPTGVYYTQWYVGGTYGGDWNEETPWCGAFASWAVAQTGAVEAFTPFASMEDGIRSFQEGENGQWLAPEESPLPGDLVFFDRDRNGEPDHVGVVTRVKDGRLYTVEGNANNRVEDGQYLREDARILGFGVLNWGRGA